MTLARKLHPSTVRADRQHASLWDDTDWTWLHDHDPEANWSAYDDMSRTAGEYLKVA